MNKADDYRIALNFLSITEDIPDFTVFRKLRATPQEVCPFEGRVRAYTLPSDPHDLEDRNSYWISAEQLDDYEQFTVQAAFNRQLVQWMLFKSLIQQCTSRLTSEHFWIPTRGFLKEIHFNMRGHPEGNEQLILQPYYLRAAEKLGFLADFHF